MLGISSAVRSSSKASLGLCCWARIPMQPLHPQGNGYLSAHVSYPDGSFAGEAYSTIKAPYTPPLPATTAPASALSATISGPAAPGDPAEWTPWSEYYTLTVSSTSDKPAYLRGGSVRSAG